MLLYVICNYSELYFPLFKLQMMFEHSYIFSISYKNKIQCHEGMNSKQSAKLMMQAYVFVEALDMTIYMSSSVLSLLIGKYYPQFIMILNFEICID